MYRNAIRIVSPRIFMWICAVDYCQWFVSERVFSSCHSLVFVSSFNRRVNIVCFCCSDAQWPHWKTSRFSSKTKSKLCKIDKDDISFKNLLVFTETIVVGVDEHFRANVVCTRAINCLHIVQFPCVFLSTSPILFPRILIHHILPPFHPNGQYWIATCEMKEKSTHLTELAWGQWSDGLKSLNWAPS